MNFVVARHISEGRILLAVCDSTIRGKSFEDKNGLILDLSSKFYRGQEMSAEETEKEMGKAYFINAVGKEAVKLVIKLKLASEENIKAVSGIPHIQVLKLSQ